LTISPTGAVVNDDDVTRLLDRRAERVPAGVIPVDAVVSEGRARIRRNRFAAVAGAALLAVLAVAGGSAIHQGATGDPNSVADSVLDAPDGTRLAGMGRAVVAVPSSWSTGETRCLKPVGDTVYVETGAMTDCSDEPSARELRRASSLAVTGNDFNYGFVGMAGMARAEGVDGVDVRESDVACTTDGLPPACSQEFVVPSEQVAFRVTVSGADAEAGVAAIRESLQILPEGYTAVPMSYGGQLAGEAWEGMPLEYVEELAVAIEEAGLRVGVAEEYRAGMLAGTYLGSDPPLGTPLELGATVTLSVSTDRQAQPPAESRLTVPSVFAHDADSAE
jgi:hypothetical protein